MTGIEHYREAEKLLADSIRVARDGATGFAAELTARAQVHATLAVAAATIDAATGPAALSRWHSKPKPADG